MEKEIELEDCIVCDKILEKFRGDITVDWPTLHSEVFYKSIHDNFFIVENNIHHLVDIGELLDVDVFNSRIGRSGNYFKLSKKGLNTISKIDKYGLVARFKKNRKKQKVNSATLIITISTFILLLINPATTPFQIKNISPIPPPIQNQLDSIMNSTHNTDSVKSRKTQIKNHKDSTSFLKIDTAKMTSPIPNRK